MSDADCPHMTGDNTCTRCQRVKQLEAELAKANDRINELEDAIEQVRLKQKMMIW